MNRDAGAVKYAEWPDPAIGQGQTTLIDRFVASAGATEVASFVAGTKDACRVLIATDIALIDLSWDGNAEAPVPSVSGSAIPWTDVHGLTFVGEFVLPETGRPPLRSRLALVQPALQIAGPEGNGVEAFGQFVRAVFHGVSRHARR